MLFRLLRVQQWYKNLVIFLPLLFWQQVSLQAFWLTLLGFFSLSFVSSANYIINDLVDRKEDRLHPEKKSRLIAAGRIKNWQANLVVLVLLVIGFVIAPSKIFAYLLIALFGLSQLYNFWLKREAFADMFVIAINFVLRAVSGAYVITRGSEPYIWVSPWLILCPFFLSLFISAGKREADVLVLGEKATSHKRVLGIYSKQMTKALTYISATLLIISYSLYSFLSVNPQLLFSLPLALYAIFRYLYLIECGSVIARKPELAYTDKRLLIGVVLWVLVVLVVLY